MTLIIFLETGNIPRSNGYFEYSTKSAAIALAGVIYNRLFTTENVVISDEEIDDDVVEVHNTNINLLQQQLHNAITSIRQIENLQTNPKANNSATSSLKKDFLLLSASQTRTNNLNNLFNALLTIKPTSTATERVFSLAGRTNTKARTRLNFQTFDAIIFLKYAFSKMK